MFNQLKTKLTLLYTLSLLCLLLLFIGVLYLLISHEINEKELDELQVYFNKEKWDFIEDLDERDHHGLKFDPNRRIFYFVFNQQDELVYGEETVRDLSSWVAKGISSKGEFFTWRTEWKQNHLLLVKKPLMSNGGSRGFVVIGMNITSEQHLIQNITWTLFILTLFFSLLFAFLGYYFAGQAMKPIKNSYLKQEKFVSDASHELRTPLSIFYSSVDLLMREEKDRLSIFGQEVLEDVKKEAMLMSNLINNLLVLARSDKKEWMLEMKEVNLSRLAASVYTRFSRKMINPIQFDQKIQKDVYIVCDEMKIQQLLYILLDNAFRYTKEGKVTLSLKAINCKIFLAVEDTGCGIAGNDLPYIFDRFYRADLSRGKGGSGLGLSIAQTIVNAHGGTIQAESTIGSGTILTVIFSVNK
ncbi:HAMP domain-containing histidine kinase [Neobacillus sp. MM2021_6]|uniref:sensor histidine kinase n=1 Tax=Bacillaceae TaxID=186817 RepID=UPI0014093C0D|nr:MULTISPECIES: HAMP domain-containing sensor histidine kinase [Bacillaceae]MBO0962040.1 HAMP domain-containing histidine kinase [Neobacillus sp. MM2021_6]NHC19947.1 HAMP domain-containing histidine kinase [Bacillus sp. MM2020_4]